MDLDETARVERELAGRAVCSDHLEDRALKAWVRDHASYSQCDYCERVEADPFAADAGELGVCVLKGLHRSWNDSIDELVPGFAYNNSKTTVELLIEEGVTEDDHLLNDLVTVLPDYGWVQREFYRLTPYERLRGGWQRFTDMVKHEARYFFTLREPDPDDPDDMPPAHILAAVGELLESASLVHEWPAGALVYRARPHDRGKVYSDAWELAAVPISKADRAAANRMSAAGVPMFYGSLDAEAAKREAESASRNPPEAITVGTFRLLQPLRVVDLTAGIDVPSIFDPERGDQHDEFAFLAGFLTDVAKPVERDGAEHIDYVPTQVVCEYLRSEHRSSDGRRISGLAYPSLQAKGHVSVVLFVANDEVANADGTRPPRPESAAWLGTLNHGPPPLLGLVNVERL